MHLRHVLVIMSAIGACASLLMALDYYRRIKEAERLVFINNITPGPDSILHTGFAQVAGLAALGIIFLAVMLVLMAALKDRAFRDAVEGRAVITDAETRGREDAAITAPAEEVLRKDAEPQSTKAEEEQKPANEPLPPVS